MKGLKVKCQNIKFHYLYRDSGNYKNFGYVVIDNPKNLSLEEFDTAIKSRLIDGEYFYANEWNLPDLRFSNFDIDNDPTWHEFRKTELTEELATHQLLETKKPSAFR